MDYFAFHLQGLTTGELPIFVDIGHSFGAPAVVEDNLILQVKFLFELDSVFKNMSTVRKGSSVVFFGRIFATWRQKKGLANPTKGF